MVPMYPVLGGTGVPAAWQQGLATGALEGKAVLIGTTRDETTAFFGFDPSIQNLTSAGALTILTDSLGGQAREVYQRHAAQRRHATPAQIFTAVQTDALFRNRALEIADYHAAGGNAAHVYQFRPHPSRGRLRPRRDPLQRVAVSLRHIRRLLAQPDARTAWRRRTCPRTPLCQRRRGVHHERIGERLAALSNRTYPALRLRASTGSHRRTRPRNYVDHVCTLGRKTFSHSRFRE